MRRLPDTRRDDERRGVLRSSRAVAHTLSQSVGSVSEGPDARRVTTWQTTGQRVGMHVVRNSSASAEIPPQNDQCPIKIAPEDARSRHARRMTPKDVGRRLGYVGAT